MCGCKLHWDQGARCTCRCPEHEFAHREDTTAGAPADTTLRDQIARVIDPVVNSHRLISPDGEQFMCLCADRGVTSGATFRLHFDALLADALFPLLRAHDAPAEPPARTAARNRLIEKRRDAQVAAQARRDALNEAANEIAADRFADHGAYVDWLRDRAEQDTPDQANT